MLSAEPLTWTESAKVEEIEASKDIHGDGRMDINIFASDGTAMSGIPSDGYKERRVLVRSGFSEPRSLQRGN